MKRRRKLWNILLFFAYSALMLWLLFDRAGGIEGMDYWKQIQANLNLEPFHTIRLFLNVLGRKDYLSAAIINLGGTVILFIPLGFFLPAIWQSMRKWYKTLLTTAGMIAVVEILQALSLQGTCDIDDLILNTFGAWIGYLIYLRINKPQKKRKKR